MIKRDCRNNNAVCRGCGKSINKGDIIFYTYSTANKGQNILFCTPCTDKIAEIMKGEVSYD